LQTVPGFKLYAIQEPIHPLNPCVLMMVNSQICVQFCDKENIHDVRLLSGINHTLLYSFLQSVNTSSKIRPFYGSQAGILSILRDAAEQSAIFDSSSVIKDTRTEEQRLLKELSPQSGAKSLLFNIGFFLASAILVPILLVFVFRISFSVLVALPPVQEIASFWTTGVAPLFQSILPRLWFAESQVQHVEEQLWMGDLMDVFLSS
jgi:hypothetical protein